MSFSYTIAPSTVHSIIISNCEAIWNKLSRTEIPQPTEEECNKKGEQFYSLWQFPNCIRPIDGKHIEIQAPHNSGSLFFNHKNTFSVILSALVDANCKFTITDVGGYGKSSDEGLLQDLFWENRWKPIGLIFPILNHRLTVKNPCPF
jgi:hypothetical protein